MNIFVPANAISTPATEVKLKEIPKGTAREKARILVVEDEPMIRTLVAAVLERYGYSVTLARNGLEGVDLFSRSPQEFQLILLDLILPVMDGNEVFQRVQTIRPGVPVLVMSGLASSLSPDNEASPGMAGFIEKPFTVPEFAQKLQAALVYVTVPPGLLPS